MAKFFSQSDIDLYKECFFYIAKNGYTKSDRELATMMRSLDQSPTVEEVSNYFNKYVKDGKIDFASFLEIMHDHRGAENPSKEILEAFQAQDIHNTGYIPTRDARRILLSMGNEGLTKREVDTMLQDGRVTGPQIRYREFVDTILTPAPDY